MSTNAIFDPAIFDGPDMFDTRQKNFSIIINDEGGAVSDLLERNAKHYRNLIEGTTPMFDGQIFDPAIFDTFGNGSAIYDSVTALKKFYVTITEDPISIMDSVVVQLKATVNLIETVVITDQVERLAKFYRSIVDTGQGIFDGPLMFDPEIFDVNIGGITVSDTVSALRGARITISENVTITDDLTRMLKSFRSFTETTNIMDSLTATKSAVINLIETVVVSDSLTRIQKSFRSFSENTVIDDAVSAIRGARITLFETVLVSDTLTRLTKHYRTFTENVVVSDIVTAFKVVGRRIRRAQAWINKRSTKAFIHKRKTNADANKRSTTARV